jgi:ATP synthase protein I
MTPATRPGSGREPAQETRPAQAQPPQERDGWRILSYLLGGMILYGGIGWVVARWTGLSFMFPLGMIVGIGLSILLIVFRVTRP